MPRVERKHMNCDECERPIKNGDRYHEYTVATRTKGEPPPLYAAVYVKCEACDANEVS